MRHARGQEVSAASSAYTYALIILGKIHIIHNPGIFHIPWLRLCDITMGCGKFRDFDFTSLSKTGTKLINHMRMVKTDTIMLTDVNHMQKVDHGFIHTHRKFKSSIHIHLMSFTIETCLKEDKIDFTFYNIYMFVITWCSSDTSLG